MKKESRLSLKARLVSLFRPEEEEQQDLHYHGKPMRRLIGYLKPHRRIFIICLLLVLALTALDLVRPIIIGNAIDRYITGTSGTPGSRRRSASGACSPPPAFTWRSCSC